MRHSLAMISVAGSPRLLKDGVDDRHVLLHCLHARPSLGASHALCSPSPYLPLDGHTNVLLTDSLWLWVEALGRLLSFQASVLYPSIESPSIAITRDGGGIWRKGASGTCPTITRGGFFSFQCCPQEFHLFMGKPTSTNEDGEVQEPKSYSKIPSLFIFF